MKLYVTRNKKQVAWIWLSPCHGGNIEVTFLRVEKEFWGSGFATQLVNRAKNIAKDVALVALIEPIKDSSLDYDQKKAWLIRHGFKEQKRYFFGDCYKRVMIFKPK